MKRVVIESPYAGNITRNIVYAKACVLDSLKRGEAPYASHLFFTQEGLLNDNNGEERALGIAAGLIWSEAADLTVVYIDFGISSGMRDGIIAAEQAGREIEYRKIEWT